MGRPVFVDRTGRRRYAAIVLGIGVTLLLVNGLVVLLTGLLGGAAVPLPGWPETARREPSRVSPPSAVTTGASPTRRRDVSASPSPAPATATAAPPTPAPGRGNGGGPGNGHGRPTKSPGKP